MAELTRKFVAAAEKMMVGNGLEPGVDVGPLIGEEALTSSLRQIEDAVKGGGTIRCGGKKVLGQHGYFLDPTVIENNVRTGILEVLFPNSERGLPPSELTIAGALKPLGYATACIGKWHLGDSFEHRPLRRGFNYYYGLLYSNDMDSPDLYRNDEKIQHPSEQNQLTKHYTEEAIAFIERSQDKPSFPLSPPYHAARPAARIGRLPNIIEARSIRRSDSRD